MTRIILGNFQFESTSNSGGLLSDNRGGFFLEGLDTRYRGWYIGSDTGPIKVLDALLLPSIVRKTFGNSQIIYHTKRDEIILSYDALYPFLRITTSNKVPLILQFDVRHIYGNPIFNHTYDYSVESGIHYFHYTHPDRELWIGLTGNDISLLPLKEWQQISYGLDAKRNSFPSERWCYKAASIEATDIILAASFTKQDLTSLLQRAETSQPKKTTDSFHSLHHALTESARQALDSCLIQTPKEQLWAGLPWFFQRWLRDEAISLGAFHALHYYEESARLLWDWIDYFTEHKTLPNMLPPEQIKTADGPAWFVFRCCELLSQASFSSTLKNRWLRALESVVDHYQRTRAPSGLFVSASQETWMDTVYHSDGRTGAALEVQSLWCACFQKLALLTHKTKYKVIEAELRKLILHHYYNQNYLADRAGDYTIRPNVFIAYYAYPTLLSPSQWALCFQTILSKLWLSWGGIATLDTGHKNFQGHSTGEDSTSYHRGDSWYWINNYAALAMHKLNPKQFSTYIRAIVRSSLSDHLFGPVALHSSETHSAHTTDRLGAPAQSWSSATLVELLTSLGDYPYKDVLASEGIKVNLKHSGNSQ